MLETSPAVLARDVTVGVLSPADLAGDVTVSVASRADLAGVIAIGVASSAEPASVVTAGVAFREECGDHVVIPTDCACTYEIAEVASLADLCWK